MLENRGLADARLATKQDGLVALDAPSDLLEQFERLVGVDERLSASPASEIELFYQI